MAFQIADRVKETTTTTGTGTLNLGGAVSQFQTFVSGIGNGNETYYSIEDPTGTDWEVGIGTVTSGAPDTLSRDTVISSSNGGSLVNFGAGEKVVFSTQPASKTFILSSDNTAVISNINASTLTAGTVNDARLSANVTLNNASTISTGTLDQDRLANSSITINGTGVALGGSINVGDITGVTAGDGLTGGGTTGAVTLNVGAGTGIDVTADTVAVDVSDFMTNGANNRIVTATGTDAMNAETNLTFDGSTLAVTGGATFTANVALGDLDHILMGPTGEYQIYHDHANGVSVIKDADVGGKINIEADNIDLTGPVVASSTVNAATFNGSGAGLTSLNASNLSSGTIPDARFPATIPTSSGANLTNLNASNVSSGTLNNARLSAIPNSVLDNSSITINGTGVSLGGSINVGDIEGVTAGSGLTGGGTTGTVTLNVGAGTGIDVSADAVAVDVSDFMTNGVNNRVLTATGADAMNAEANMTFDGSVLSVTGNVNASSTFNGSGAGLTTLNASNVSSGTLPNARLSAVPNSALDNSSITINGTGVSLGGSINVGDITGVTAGDGLTGGGTTGAVTLNVGAGTLIDVAADTVSVDLSELTTSTSDADGDFFVVVDSVNAQKKLTKGNINLSGFNNDAGFSTTTGTVTSVSGGNGLTGTVTTSGSLNVGAGTLIDVTADAVNVDLSELATSTSDADGDFFCVVDSANAQKKLTKGNINISGFNNDAGYTTNVGDITGVTAGTNLTGGGTSGTVTLNMATGGIGAGTYGSTANGTKIDTITVDAYGRVTAVATGATGDIEGVTAGSGLTGGGTSGTVTLNVGAGTGIDVAADAISVDVSDFMTNGSNNRVLTATGTDAMNAEANMTFDGSTLDVSGTILTDKAYIALATLTDGATISWNMSTQSVAKVTLGGNRTIAAPTNGSTGQFASITVIQDGTGSRTLTWNAVYEFKDDTAPTLTTTGGKGDLFVFQYNGSKWLEVGRNLNLTQS